MSLSPGRITCCHLPYFQEMFFLLCSQRFLSSGTIPSLPVVKTKNKQTNKKNHHLSPLLHNSITDLKSKTSKYTSAYLFKVLSQSVQAAVTNYHRLCGLNNKLLFLTVLEPRKSKSKRPEDLVSNEAPLPSLQMAVFSL